MKVTAGNFDGYDKEVNWLYEHKGRKRRMIGYQRIVMAGKSSIKA